MEILSTGKSFGKTCLDSQKMIVVMLSALLSLAFAHDADPSNLLTSKYSIFGADEVKGSGGFGTAVGGRVGTNQNLIVPSWQISNGYGANFGGAVWVRGDINFGSHSDNMRFISEKSYVMGNITGSGKISLSKDFYYAGVNSVTSNGAGSFVADAGTNVPEIVFPLYAKDSTTADNCSYSGNWTCSISGTHSTLPEGKYGTLSVTSGTAVLGAGRYWAKSLTIPGGTNAVINNGDEVTRIILTGDFKMAGGSGQYFRSNGTTASVDTNYNGKIMLHVMGTASFVGGGTTFHGTLYAPNTTVVLKSELKLFGQVFANKIDMNNNFDGGAGKFVSFDPSGVKLVGASTFSINENSDVTNTVKTNNSRLINIPVKLSAVTTENASLKYTIRTLSMGESWASGKTSATIGTDTVGNDIAVGSTFGASDASGTLNFLIGEDTATTSLNVFVNDDGLAEKMAGEKEYIELKLHSAVKLKFEADVDAVYADADSLIYILPVVSDDPGNTSPTRVSELADLSLLEDFSNLNITQKLDTLFNDPEGDALTYGLVSSSKAWGNASVTGTTLKYDNVADSNGIDTLIVSASDGEFTIYDTLKVIVKAVNDAPDFVSGNNVSSAEELAYSALWATSLSKGPVDESGQSLNFDVLSISDSTLFSVLPVLSPTGVLSFTGATNKTGVTTVSVRLKDDGGVLDSGVDSTSARSFTITLTNVNDDPNLDSTIQNVSLDEDFADTLVYKGIRSMVSDVDGDTVTAISVNVLGNVLGNASVEGDDIKLTSKLNANGSDSVEVLITISGVVLKDTFVVNVSPVNDDPTGLSLSQDSIVENSAVGTQVGVFAITDVDNVTADFNFELDDSTYFSVVGNRLVVNSELDYEALKALGKDTLTVEVTATDKSDSASQITQSFSIRVLDQNDSPYRNGSLENLVLNEDFNDTIAIAQLDTLFTDPEGQTLTYSFEIKKNLTTLSDSANHVEFSSIKDVFGVDTLIITATDPSALSVSDTILINITAVNDDPIVKDTVGSVSENVNDGKTIVTIEVVDVDKDSIRYELLDSNSLFVVDELGQIKLKEGVELDFESLQADTLTVVVSDGIAFDTSKIIINVLNEVEKSDLQLIKVDDKVKVWEGVLDTVWSNQLNYVFTYTESGVLVDSAVILSKNLETTGYGIQEVVRVFKDESKELADTVVSYIVFNANGPDIRVDTSVTKLPVDSNGVIYINNPDEEIKFIIDEVSKDPTKTVRIDTLVVGPLNEGQIKQWVVSYTDKYGNTSSDTIQVVLDTTPPQVEITKPSDNYLLTSLYAEVDWTVDGVLMNYDTTETLVEGFNVITRSYSDFAGNVGVDSVRVRVVIEGNKIAVDLVNQIIKGERDDAKVEKYFSDRNRVEPEDESWNLSFQIPDDDTQEFTNSNAYIETFYHDGGKKNEVLEEDQVPYSMDAEDQIGISLSVDMHFPVIQPRGTSGDDTPKGVCEDGSMMWDLGVDYMKVAIYDQLGQFVRTELITEFSVDSRFQNKEGIVNARFDLPSLEADLRASDGRKWAAGIYLLHIEVQTTAVGINCNEGERESNRIGTMKRQGYSRN